MTDVEDPKDPDTSLSFQILEQFADPEVIAEVRKRLEDGGTGWGELKDELFEVLDALLGPLRARYDELMAPASELDDLLTAGADTTRARARVVLSNVRDAVGVG